MPSESAGERTEPPPLVILVVDDNSDAAETTAALLDLAGFAARTAMSGADALRLAAVNPPDVVLLDLKMPEMDGYELARRLREKSAVRRPLLVAVTGCTSESDHRRSADAGIDLHLNKPVEPGVLVGMLRRFARVLAPAGQPA